MPDNTKPESNPNSLSSEIHTIGESRTRIEGDSIVTEGWSDSTGESTIPINQPIKQGDAESPKSIVYQTREELEGKPDE